LILFCW